MIDFDRLRNIWLLLQGKPYIHPIGGEKRLVAVGWRPAGEGWRLRVTENGITEWQKVVKEATK